MIIRLEMQCIGGETAIVDANSGDILFRPVGDAWSDFLVGDDFEAVRQTIYDQFNATEVGLSNANIEFQVGDEVETRIALNFYDDGLPRYEIGAIGTIVEIGAYPPGIPYQVKFPYGDDGFVVCMPRSGLRKVSK